MYDDDGILRGSIEQICDAINESIDNGINIISMSLGFQSGLLTENQKNQLKNAILEAYYNGIIIIVAVHKNK